MSIFDVDYINVVWELLVPPDKRQPNFLAWGNSVMAGKQWKGSTFFDGYMQGAQYLTPPVTPAGYPGNAYSPSYAYVTGNRVVYPLQSVTAGFTGSNQYFGDNAVYEALCINPDGSINPSGFAGLPPSGVNLVPSVVPDNITTPAQAIAWLYNYNGNYPTWQSQNYVVGQIVFYALDQSLYLCIQNTTSDQDPNDITYWQFYSRPGCMWIQVQPNFIGANERASYSCQKTIYEYALNKWFNTTFRQPLTPDTSDSGSDIYITNNTINQPQFYFFPNTQGGSYYSLATYLSGIYPSKYFFPSNTFTQINDFSIYIPVAVYNALVTTTSPFGEAPVTPGPTTLGTKRNGIVRAFADLLCPAGANYNIITY